MQSITLQNASVTPVGDLSRLGTDLARLAVAPVVVEGIPPRFGIGIVSADQAKGLNARGEQAVRNN